MIFIAILARQLSAASVSVTVRGMFPANVTGGLIAMIVHDLVVAAPFVPLMVMVSLTVIFAFARIATGSTRWRHWLRAG
jgi:hypothetical protein